MKPRSYWYWKNPSRIFWSLFELMYFSFENIPRYACRSLNSFDMRKRNCVKSSRLASPYPSAFIHSRIVVIETVSLDFLPVSPLTVLAVANGGLMRMIHLMSGFARSAARFGGILRVCPNVICPASAATSSAR